MHAVGVSFPGPLVRAEYRARPNRFAAVVRLADGSEAYVHVPDPGRLRELFVPGATLWLTQAPHSSLRATQYDVLLVETDAGLVSVDTRLPNLLVRRALEARALPEFVGYTQVRAEVAFGHSRLDFLLCGPESSQLVEVKSVTLVEGGVGLFPDAVTARGTRHVQDLSAAVSLGLQAAVLFVVQREDAVAVAPHAGNDPAFAQALRYAAAAGVQLVAYTCRLTLRGISLGHTIPCRLDGGG